MFTSLWFVQARQLVGSTLLVREEDRPELEQGEAWRTIVKVRPWKKIEGVKERKESDEKVRVLNNSEAK